MLEAIPHSSTTRSRMPKSPLPLRNYLTGTKTLRSLIAETSRQARLLAQVKAEIPAPLDEHLLAVLLNARRLVIYTDSPAWCSRFRFVSRSLRERLLRKGLALDKVVVRVMIVASPLPARNRSARKLTADNAALLNQVADSISDPLLSSALQRLARHSR